MLNKRSVSSLSLLLLLLLLLLWNGGGSTLILSSSDILGNGIRVCWRRWWHPTPVLLPGKPHGWRSLVGCSPWGRYESDMTARLHFNALEKEMATHSSVLAWRITGTGGLPSLGSHRVGHDWGDLAAAAAAAAGLSISLFVLRSHNSETQMHLWLINTGVWAVKFISVKSWRVAENSWCFFAVSFVCVATLSDS